MRWICYRRENKTVKKGYCYACLGYKNVCARMFIKGLCWCMLIYFNHIGTFDLLKEISKTSRDEQSYLWPSSLNICLKFHDRPMFVEIFQSDPGPKTKLMLTIQLCCYQGNSAGNLHESCSRLACWALPKKASHVKVYQLWGLASKAKLHLSPDSNNCVVKRVF